MKRFVLILLFLGLCAGGYILYTKEKGSSESKKTSLRTETAKLRDLELTVSATGEVLPVLSSIVKSEVSGRIEKLLIDEGTSVKKGDLLLQLDRASLESRVRETERNVAADKLRLEKSKRNFERLSELYKKEFIGEQEFLDAQTDFNLSKLNLEIAQARLVDVEETLAKTLILAPHDGMVSKMDIVEGQVISGAVSVSNGTELLTLSKMEELYMEAQINEVDIGVLELGQQARLTFDSIQDVVVEGTIGRIAVSGQKEDNIRTFPIEVVFEVKNTDIRPGISATVEVPVASTKDAVSVRLSAVYLDDGKEHVYVQNGSEWDKREVEIGINDLQYIEVLSGLSVDEVVALSRPLEYRNSDG